MTPDSPQPIILIGAARSGTKFLRGVLSAGQGTAAVPYDVNYVWRYGTGDAPDDVLDRANLTPKQGAFIRGTLRSLARAEVGDVLIEKTVSNTVRVPYVDAVYPNVRYVHLIRDGREVVESAMRQWEAPPDWSALRQKVRDIQLENLGYVWWFGKNFLTGLFSKRGGGKVWGPRYPGIDADAASLSLAQVCARQWVASVETARRDLAGLPADRVFEIRYEDLLTDGAALAGLVAALNLPDAQTILVAHATQLRRPRGSRFDTLAAGQQAAILGQVGSTLETLGYMS